MQSYTLNEGLIVGTVWCDDSANCLVHYFLFVVAQLAGAARVVVSGETNRKETSNQPAIATPMVATSSVVCNVFRGVADWTSTSSEILLKR